MEINVDQDARQEKRPKAPKLPIYIAALVIIVVATIILVTRESDKPAPIVMEPVKPVVQTPPPQLPAEVDESPDIPEIEAPLDDEEPAQEVQLPSPAESDEFVREVLLPVNASEEYALWLQSENIAQKSVTVIDGLSRGNILRKIIPVKPPTSTFIVSREDDRIVIDPSNYDRYNTIVEIITSLSPEALAQAYHTLSPILRASFPELGYPADKFDNTLIAALNRILEVPDINEPIALKSESVAYTYADPNLESLPELDKQFIRIGSENRAKIKQFVSELKGSLLMEQETPEY